MSSAAAYLERLILEMLYLAADADNPAIARALRHAAAVLRAALESLN